jgi:hypothetical protein
MEDLGDLGGDVADGAAHNGIGGAHLAAIVEAAVVVDGADLGVVLGGEEQGLAVEARPAVDAPGADAREICGETRT